MFDYLIVGAGLYGAVFAQQAKRHGKKVLVVERRPHIAGNIYTEKINDIHVHKYGAHIFHTNKKDVWDYVNSFATFNRFTNSPIAVYKGKGYSLPFSMYTFNQMWGVIKPDEAQAIIENQRQEAHIVDPKNLEEQAISLVGKDVYETLVKGYTEKQWGRSCVDLPASIIKRLPVRFTYDNNYFNSLYQGIPQGGYTEMVQRMLGDIEVQCNIDYLENKKELDSLASKVLYTGPVDAYFDYKYGYLAYRSVRFETELMPDNDNYQGNAVVNYTERDIPWTRIIEHKWFEFGKDDEGENIKGTIISKEYSTEWKPGMEPYYPVNDKVNSKILEMYNREKELQTNVIFGGRLAEYQYYDMDKVVELALKKAKEEFGD